jgi:DNA-directed RNA polymerase specialized sigma24 family protein
MAEESSFQELIARVRARDNDACVELERRYGETLRRMARVRLLSFDLQRLVNPSDVVQSVMAAFFHEAAGGNYSLDTPDNVLKLLKTMVRRKVNDHVKKETAEKRTPAPRPEPIGPSPSTVVAEKELFEKVWNGLAPADRDFVRLVVWDKLSWAEVAERIGAKPDAARKRYERLCASAREQWMGGET